MQPQGGGSKRGGAVFLATIVLGLAAGGILLIVNSFKQRAEAAEFADRAVSVEARVIFATETRRFRSPAYTEARVGFSTPGEIGPTFADVTDCPEDRIPVDAESVTVLYDPTDETDVRAAGCLGKGYNLALVSGAGLLLLDIALVIGIRRGRVRVRSPGEVAGPPARNPDAP